MAGRTVVVSMGDDTSPAMATWIKDLSEPFDSIRVIESGPHPNAQLPFATAVADLVVMDAQRTAEGLQTVEAVVDSGDAEILVASRWPDGRHKPIAVLVRDPAQDLHVIDTAFSVAEALGSQLNVIHHWTVRNPEFFVYEETAHQRLLDGLLASLHEEHPSVAVTVELLFGPWSDAVMRVEHHPLLVMGRPVNRHDSVVDNVLSLRDLPVLLVPVVELPSANLSATAADAALAAWLQGTHGLSGESHRTEAEARAAHPAGKRRRHLTVVK